jgi:hypothetical protein
MSIYRGLGGAGDAINDATISAISGYATSAMSSANSASVSAGNASVSAGNASGFATAAAASLDSFEDTYLGHKITDPALDNDGNALLTGALYYNSANKEMRVYTGTGWINASTTQVETLHTYVYVATAAQTVFTGVDASSNTLSFTSPYLIVSLNGLQLRSIVDYTTTGTNTITLVSGASVGDELQVQAFANFNVANIQAADVSFMPAGTGVVTTTVQGKLRESVSVKDFGAVGDGVTDDTAAIQMAIDRTSLWNTALIFPEGQYAVTSITTRGKMCTWYFEQAELLAIGTTVTTCVLKIDSFNSKFYGLVVNLNKKLNYNCAVWWYNAAAPSQYNCIFGLSILFAWRGLVYGEFPGSTSNSLAQSENSIFGYQCYGVWQPLVMNHNNGVLFFSGSQFVSGDQGWGGAFDNTQNFAFTAYAGALTIAASEIQNSVAANTSYCAIVQGGEVYLDGCIIETDAPFQISGRLSINGGRIINTRTDTNQFWFGASAGTSKLNVSNCWISRVPTSGSYAALNLVKNAGTSQYLEYTFSNCNIEDWPLFVNLVETNNQYARFDNCRWYPDGTKDAATEVYLLDTKTQNIIDVPTRDTKGYSLSGWYQNVWYGGTSAATLNVDVPNTKYSKSIAVTSTGQAAASTMDSTSLTTMKATGFPVGPQDKFMIEAWVKTVSGTGTLSIVLYDSTGALLADPFQDVANTQVINSTWQYIRGVLSIPVGSTAAYAGFGAAVLTGEVRFCGMKVRRANWNML